MEPLTNVLEHLRKHIVMHLGQPVASAATLCALVAEDALHLGAQCVNLRILDDRWYLVSSATDWTRIGNGGDLALEELFERLVPLPEAGINEVRHESYLAAYCQDVFVSRQSRITSITGRPPTPDLIDLLEGNLFHVGFRVDRK